MPTAVRARGTPRVLADNKDDVLACAVSGSESAFDVLVTALTPSLQRLAECMLKDADRASGAVQDAWLAALGRMRTFESVDHLTRWMYRVVRCRAISAIRRQRRMNSVAWNDEPGEEPGLPSPAVEEREDPSRELADVVRDVVDRLPDPYRGVATLSFLHHQSHAQIALLLQLSAGTVKMRLHRARAWLRKRLCAHVQA